MIFPTRCLYGLAARAASAGDVRRVFAAKGRAAEKPLSVLIPDRSHLDSLVRRVPAAAERLMERFWPGGLTLVFEDSGRLPDVLTAKTGKIGIRLPRHPAAVLLVRMLNEPITATSANISGAPGVHAVAGLAPELIESVDLILDAGVLELCPGSTLVDVTETPPRVLREGTVSSRKLLGVLKNQG